jgi:hypothetical protein
MIGKILCRFGIHDWVTFSSTRYCKRCPKKQALFAVGMEEGYPPSGMEGRKLPRVHVGWKDHDWTKDPF